MRVTAITFAGYQSGHTAFDEVFSTNPDVEQQQLISTIELIADGIIEPGTGPFVSIITVGHSDRQDRADFSCDQRRASEISASTDRAVSAWEWLKARVQERCLQSGVDAGEWWENAQGVTWALVFAAAGMLRSDPPAGEPERAQNRRVVFLVSFFDR